jgi:hypothetical protein
MAAARSEDRALQLWSQAPAEEMVEDAQAPATDSHAAAVELKAVELSEAQQPAAALVEQVSAVQPVGSPDCAAMARTPQQRLGHSHAREHGRYVRRV